MAKSTLQTICAYCGEPANTRDHLIPAAFAQTKRHFDCAWVWACVECNNTLSSKFFDSLNARASYVFDRYSTKYRKLLTMPTWEQDELEDIGPNLRSTIESAIKYRKIILRRIRYLEYVKSTGTRYLALHVRNGKHK